MGRRDVETMDRTIRPGHFLALQVDGDFRTRRGVKLGAQAGGDVVLNDQRQ